VGFPEWTAQFCVWKTIGKDSSEACAIACQNCAVYSVFPSGMTSHSEIAQFNWQCIGRLKRTSKLCWMSQGCTNPGRQVSVATKYRTVTRNACGFSVLNLLHVTLLAPRILRWSLDFWNFCAPLLCKLMYAH